MDTFTKLLSASKNVHQTREVFLKKSLKEKRSLYKCKNYVTLNEIPTWQKYYNEQKLSGKSKSSDEINANYVANDVLNSKIGVFTGDITCLEIDSIVNAANKKLLGGGGVDGAIHRAAGSHLLEECRTLNGCKTGEAKITAGYNLPAKYVIHTVGPIGYYPDDLKNAYTNSLDLALKNEIRSIAFPCISTGVYGYPNEEAAREVLELLRNYLEKNHEKIDRIILCLFMRKDIDLYKRYLQKFFPISTVKNRLKSADSFVSKSLVEPVNNLEMTDKNEECRVVETVHKPPKAVAEPEVKIVLEENKKIEKESCQIVETVQEGPKAEPAPEYKIKLTNKSNIDNDSTEGCLKTECSDIRENLVNKSEETPVLVIPQKK